MIPWVRHLHQVAIVSSRSYSYYTQTNHARRLPRLGSPQPHHPRLRRSTSHARQLQADLRRAESEILEQRIRQGNTLKKTKSILIWRKGGFAHTASRIGCVSSFEDWVCAQHLVEAGAAGWVIETTSERLCYKCKSSSISRSLGRLLIKVCRRRSRPCEPHFPSETASERVILRIRTLCLIESLWCLRSKYFMETVALDRFIKAVCSGSCQA